MLCRSIVVALAVVARHREPTRGRRIAMEGAIAALDLKLAKSFMRPSHFGNSRASTAKGSTKKLGPRTDTT